MKIFKETIPWNSRSWKPVEIIHCSERMNLNPRRTRLRGCSRFSRHHWLQWGPAIVSCVRKSYIATISSVDTELPRLSTVVSVRRKCWVRLRCRTINGRKHVGKTLRHRFFLLDKLLFSIYAIIEVTSCFRTYIVSTLKKNDVQTISMTWIKPTYTAKMPHFPRYSPFISCWYKTRLWFSTKEGRKEFGIASQTETFREIYSLVIDQQKVSTYA